MDKFPLGYPVVYARGYKRNNDFYFRTKPEIDNSNDLSLIRNIEKVVESVVNTDIAEYGSIDSLRWYVFRRAHYLAFGVGFSVSRAPGLIEYSKDFVGRSLRAISGVVIDLRMLDVDVVSFPGDEKFYFDLARKWISKIWNDSDSECSFVKPDVIGGDFSDRIRPSKPEVFGINENQWLCRVHPDGSDSMIKRCLSEMLYVAITGAQDFEFVSGLNVPGHAIGHKYKNAMVLGAKDQKDFQILTSVNSKIEDCARCEKHDPLDKNDDSANLRKRETQVLPGKRSLIQEIRYLFGGEKPKQDHSKKSHQTNGGGQDFKVDKPKRSRYSAGNNEVVDANTNDFWEFEAISPFGVQGKLADVNEMPISPREGKGKQSTENTPVRDQRISSAELPSSLNKSTNFSGTNNEERKYPYPSRKEENMDPLGDSLENDMLPFGFRKKSGPKSGITAKKNENQDQDNKPDGHVDFSA